MPKSRREMFRSWLSGSKNTPAETSPQAEAEVQSAAGLAASALTRRTAIKTIAATAAATVLPDVGYTSSADGAAIAAATPQIAEFEKALWAIENTFVNIECLDEIGFEALAVEHFGVPQPAARKANDRNITNLPDFLTAILSDAVTTVDMLYKPITPKESGQKPFALIDLLKTQFDMQNTISNMFQKAPDGSITPQMQAKQDAATTEIRKMAIVTLQSHGMLPAGFDVEKDYDELKYLCDEILGDLMSIHEDLHEKEFWYESNQRTLEERYSLVRRESINRILSNLIKITFWDNDKCGPKTGEAALELMPERGEAAAELIAYAARHVTTKYGMHGAVDIRRIVRPLDIPYEPHKQIVEDWGDYARAAETMKIPYSSKTSGKSVEFDMFRSRIKDAVKQQDREEWITKVHRGGTGRGNDVY